MVDPRINEISIIHIIFGVVHLIYFIIYYGRYSTLNQKLNGVLKMERAGIVDQTFIEASKQTLQRKIAKFRKWSFLPILAIGIIHLIYLICNLPDRKTGYILVRQVISTEKVKIDFTMEYLIVGCIAFGSVLFIALGNYVKGAEIIGPNRRYHMSRRFW